MIRRRLPLLGTTLVLSAALVAVAVVFLFVVEVDGEPLGRLLFDRFDATRIP